MSLSILCNGTLANDPVRRTSNGGNEYATASLRVAVEDDAPVFVSIVAFGAHASALLAHGKGDSIAVTGRGKLTSWTGRDGEERHGLSVIIDALLTPYQIRTKRERVAEAAAA